MKTLAAAILMLLTLAACDGSPGCHPPITHGSLCTGTDGGNYPFYGEAPPPAHQ